MNIRNSAKRICRIAAAVMAALMILCLALPALHADVIFEPQDNFYQEHHQDMRYANKVYIAPGTVEGYESPEDDDVLLTASEGTRLYISFVYTDENGQEWGVYDWDSSTCWFRLNDLVPEYDTRDFISDHGSEFTDYADQLADLPLDGGEIPLWKYPGSEDQWGSIYLDEYFVHSDYASFVYTDREGRDWVYFPYVFGMEGWANADDPFNTDPVVFDASTPAETPAPAPAPTDEPIAKASTEPLPTEEPLVDDAPDGGHPMGLGIALLIVLAIAAVGFVVILSVVLIIVFYVLNKKKKS